MLTDKLLFSVFTKPWKSMPLEQLAAFVKKTGFDGIEFPLRNGFHIKPENAEEGLPELVKIMGDYGVKVTSIAGNTDERTFAGCASAGIDIIRIMCNLDIEKGYWLSEQEIKEEIAKAIPLCERYGVKIGVQHHYGAMISNSMELHNLVKDFNPGHVGAIWDAAHSALAGEEPELGLDIVRSHLCMINFKNAYYRQISGSDAENTKWDRYFTSGRNGMASWPRIANHIKKMGYEGVLCLHAEYSNEAWVDTLISEDIEYLKALLCN